MTEYDFKEPFKGDIWYYIDEANEQMISVYYNPDSASGGQIVEQHIPYTLIIEAEKNTDAGETAFFSYIDNVAVTELVDIGTEDFQNAIEYYSHNEPTFKNITRSELVQLAADERTHREYITDTPFIAEPIVVDDTMTKKDLLQQQLENGIKSVLNSESFKNWLNTSGKLFYRNYSFQNAMLIWSQKPDASYVMSYEKWKDFGRNVVRGATGAKIFVPLMAYEKSKGILFKSIKKNLIKLLAENPNDEQASYRLGTSKLEFTMNRVNNLYGYKINGVERYIFSSEDEVKRFIERTIIGKLPVGFTTGTVFDIKDVDIPEYLWVKRGYTKDELALDTNGSIVKNKRGEVRIFNTPERQARFQTSIGTPIKEKNPEAMRKLFDVCMSVSLKKGVPVFLANKRTDEALGSGANGYYSRETSNVAPNGYIVIDEELGETEKCAVLLHEMGHADLHKNLDALAQQMGEQKISKEMREIQAEAVAFATASVFGIETDTSSFAYLAVYSRGFELQDFKKSLEVIFKESNTLVNDIKAELDARGLTLEMTEKEKPLLDADTLKNLSTRYLDFYTEFNDTVQAAMDELPLLVKNNVNNQERIDILRHQKENLTNQKSDLNRLIDEIQTLNNATSRQTQDESILAIESIIERVQTSASAFEKLSLDFIQTGSNDEKNLLAEFREEPFEALNYLQSNHSRLTELSSVQIKYLAGSRFVKDELVRRYGYNEELLVEKMIERSGLITTVSSENGTFVEIGFCEQWTETPIFEKGTLCSPAVANIIIASAEQQIGEMRGKAAEQNGYFPYAKCDLTIFTPDESGGLVALHTRIDIGDGEQKDLMNHLNQICKYPTQEYVKDKFASALEEPAYKDKIIVQNMLPFSPINLLNEENNKSLTSDEWHEKIAAKRESAERNNATEVIKNAIEQDNNTPPENNEKTKHEQNRKRDKNNE